MHKDLISGFPFLLQVEILQEQLTSHDLFNIIKAAPSIKRTLTQAAIIALCLSEGDGTICRYQHDLFTMRTLDTQSDSLETEFIPLLQSALQKKIQSIAIDPFSKFEILLFLARTKGLSFEIPIHSSEILMESFNWIYNHDVRSGSKTVLQLLMLNQPVEQVDDEIKRDWEAYPHDESSDKQKDKLFVRLSFASRECLCLLIKADVSHLKGLQKQLTDLNQPHKKVLRTLSYAANSIFSPSSKPGVTIPTIQNEIRLFERKIVTL